MKKALALFPKKGTLSYAVIKLYEKVADQNLKKGNLYKAFSNITEAIKMGNAYTHMTSKKIRSKVYHAYALKEKDTDQQLQYIRWGLKDDPKNKDLNVFAYNLYLHLASIFIDQRKHSKAMRIFKKAIDINTRYKETYELYDRNSYNPGSVGYMVAIAEVYAINLRYDDAIRILERYRHRNSSLKPRIIYNLAKLSASKGRKNQSIRFLKRFFTDESLVKYYANYRKIASREPNFLLLENDKRFYRWVNGINRIKLSLNYIKNIPQVDIFSKSDAYIKISHRNRTILTTVKGQDQSYISWPKDRYHAVFDYDYDEAINFKVVDSDLTYDDVIFDNMHSEFHPSGWNVILSKRHNTILNVTVEDCSYCPSEYSTYTSLPPKFWLWTWFEDRQIRQNQNSLSTVYSPEIELEYQKAYRSYYTVWGLFSKLSPCFISSGLSKFQKGFFTRQFFYSVIQALSDQLNSYRKFTIEALIEAVIKSVGSQLLDDLNNFRTFCECAYKRIKT